MLFRSNIIHMTYRDDQVTTLGIFSMFENDDDEAASRTVNLLASTLLSLAYIAGEDVNAITTEQMRTIIGNFSREVKAEYWGYKFDPDVVIENNSMGITILVTK